MTTESGIVAIVYSFAIVLGNVWVPSRTVIIAAVRLGMRFVGDTRSSIYSIARSSLILSSIYLSIRLVNKHIIGWHNNGIGRRS